MLQFKNILCVISAEDPSRPSLERAISLAKNNQAQLTIVDVVPRVTAGIRLPAGVPDSADLQTAMTADRLQALQSLTEPYQQGLHIQHEVLTGTGFLEIIRAVLRNGYDLLIKSAENPSYLDRVFGSDDMHLLRKCPCPVWLTHSVEKSNYQCILAAVDFEPEKPDTVEQPLNQQILELASSLARTGIAGLLIGNTAETILEQLKCSVLAIKPPGFITPVKLTE